MDDFRFSDQRLIRRTYENETNEFETVMDGRS